MKKVEIRTEYLVEYQDSTDDTWYYGEPVDDIMIARQSRDDLKKIHPTWTFRVKQKHIETEIVEESSPLPTLISGKKRFKRLII